MNLLKNLKDELLKNNILKIQRKLYLLLNNKYKPFKAQYLLY